MKTIKTDSVILAEGCINCIEYTFKKESGELFSFVSNELQYKLYLKRLKKEDGVDNPEFIKKEKVKYILK